jgi:hypothetical protein
MATRTELSDGRVSEMLTRVINPGAGDLPARGAEAFLRTPSVASDLEHVRYLSVKNGTYVDALTQHRRSSPASGSGAGSR